MGVDRKVGYRELLVWYDVDYDRGFGEGNGNEMGIKWKYFYWRIDWIGRDRINVGLALIYMGLIGVGWSWMRVG